MPRLRGPDALVCTRPSRLFWRDVLPQLGSDRLQDVSEVADDGKTSQYGVSLLQEVVDHDGHERESQNPEPHGQFPVEVGAMSLYFIPS